MSEVIPNLRGMALFNRAMPTGPNVSGDPTSSGRTLAPVAQHSDTTEQLDWALINQLRRDATTRLYEDINEQRPTGAARARLSEIKSDENRARARQIVEELVAQQSALTASGGGEAPSVVQEQRMSKALMDAIFGLGRIQPLVDNPQIKNIEIRGNKPTILEMVDGSIEDGPPVVDTDEELLELMQFWADRGDRKFSDTDPILNLSLEGNERLAAGVRWTKRPVATIRLHRHQEFTLEQLVNAGMLTRQVADCLIAAVKAEKSVVLVGEQGSGKTTLLRALIRAALDRYTRLMTIEREYELGFSDDEFPRIIDAQAIQGAGERSPDGNVIGEFGPRLILQQAGFRMNVEVLVVGEVKEAEEAGALIDTLHTSPRTMTSVHGATARGGMDRLIDLYAQSGVPYEIARSSMCDHVDLLVHCRKGRESGHRVDEVIHVENGEPGVASTVLFENIDGMLVERQWHESLDGLRAHGYERHQSVMGLA